MKLCSLGLLYRRGSTSIAPQLGHPRKDFASGSTSGPQVSASKGIDTGLITVHRKNLSVCHQREEHRLMEKEKVLGSLCIRGCTDSYSSCCYSSLMGKMPGECCP